MKMREVTESKTCPFRNLIRSRLRRGADFITLQCLMTVGRTTALGHSETTLVRTARRFISGLPQKLTRISTHWCIAVGGQGKAVIGHYELRSLLQKSCGRLWGESRPRANPVWGRGGVGT